MSASYPGSAKVFTARSAGQSIASAHVNDLQDEVSAMQTGLLGGTAPVTSSNTSVVNLNVSGNSTVVGNLFVTGNSSLTGNLNVLGTSTFTGNVTINGTLTVNAGRVRLTHTAKQDIPNSAFTALNWDTETYDVGGLHSTSANSSRVTFAPSTGAWHIGASVEWNASTGGIRILRLLMNDTIALAASYEEPTVVGILIPQSVSMDINVTSTADFVTAQVFQSNGSTASVTAGGSYATAFWAHKL